MSYPGYPNQAPGYPAQPPIYQQPMGFNPNVLNQQPMGLNQPCGITQFPQHNQSPYPANPGITPLPGQCTPSYGQNQPTAVYLAGPIQLGYTSLANPGQHQPVQGIYNGPVSTIKLTPTVQPVQPFNPKQDAEILRKAMKGFGTDETTIINVLANRSNQQRMEIKSQFSAVFSRDLIKDFKSELSGKFEDLVLATMMPVPELLARELHRAISGVGTNEDILIEILCTLDNDTIKATAALYQKLFKKSLESDIKGDTSGHFERLLVSLCQGNRDQNPTVNMQGAVTDAQALYKAGAGRVGTDEKTFNSIMTSRSFPQLRQIFIEYPKVSSGKTMEKSIKSEFSGDIKKAHLAIVKYATSSPDLFAEKLYDSMHGVGTKDKDLIRLVTWRSELDMGDIKTAFQNKYKKSLQSFIDNDTSGDYKKMLLAMVK